MSKATVEKRWIYRGMELVVIHLDFGLPEHLKSEFLEGGHRCGYVGLLPSHALHGRDYSHVDADVHGGLTYADRLSRVAGLEDSQRWFFGFDCGHYMDKIADWPIERVADQCEKLADQLYSLRNRWVNWFVLAGAKIKEWWESDFRKRK